MIKFLMNKAEKADINNFTSNFGMKLRRLIQKPMSIIYRGVIRVFYKKKITVNRMTKLDKKKCYIFAINHSFYLDGGSVIATNDRNCYSLFGATEQLHDDPCTIFIWMSGLIYVNRFDKQSRKDSVKKMDKVLKSGSSIMLFPEGRWNDSENLLCQKIFSGAYNLSFENQVEVVPVSVYNETLNKNIYVTYGKPLKLYDYDKDMGLQILRDNLATMLYEQIEKYSTPFEREKIKGDIHFDYMDKRMYEYSKAKWKSDYCWDDELFVYKSGDIDLEEVWENIDKIEITEKNKDIFEGLIDELNRRKKYNFANYMNENYRKKY